MAHTPHIRIGYKIYPCEVWIHHHGAKKRGYEKHFHLHIHGACKDLSRYLEIPLGLSISFNRIGKRHMITFDRSGADICHLLCLKKILNNRRKGMVGYEVFKNLGSNLKIWKGSLRYCDIVFQ